QAREVRVLDRMHRDRGGDTFAAEALDQRMQAVGREEAEIELDGHSADAAFEDRLRQSRRFHFAVSSVAPEFPATGNKRFVLPDQLLSGRVGKYRDWMAGVQAGCQVSGVFGDTAARIPGGDKANREFAGEAGRGCLLRVERGQAMAPVPLRHLFPGKSILNELPGPGRSLLPLGGRGAVEMAHLFA